MKKNHKLPLSMVLSGGVLLLILLLAVTVMFAAVTSNYGTAIRHRCKLFPIILLIVADELRKSRIQIGTRK